MSLVILKRLSILMTGMMKRSLTFWQQCCWWGLLAVAKLPWPILQQRWAPGKLMRLPVKEGRWLWQVVAVFTVCWTHGCPIYSCIACGASSYLWSTAASVMLGCCLPCLDAAEPCTAFCCVHLQKMQAAPCRNWASACWS